MANLSLKGINKIYPNNVQAVFDFNLDIADKEFIVFVGPSGCGKSTTLRMIAGLEEISSGELYIDNELVNTKAPKDRDIAMVFQNYALYPHMTNYNNIAFGLKIRKLPVSILDKDGNEIMIIDKEKVKYLKSSIKYLKSEINDQNERAYASKGKNLKAIQKLEKAETPDQEKIEALKKENEKLDADYAKLVEKNTALVEKYEKDLEYFSTTPSTPKVKYVHMKKDEIDKRVKWAAEILGLTQYLNRKPGALSGGQRQRVALGRAIVRQPKVFLMDEPLSNLDAKLRVQMRKEIIHIHQRVNATTIYVTHDQTEAMTMADRIVVMKDGYIQQIGSPKDVYDNPNNVFVAGFIGAPAMNFYNGKIVGKKFVFDGDENNTISLTSKAFANIVKNYKDKEIILGVRPEHTVLKPKTKDENLSTGIKVKADIVELLGHESVVYGDICGQGFSAKMSSEFNIKQDDINEYCFNLNHIYFFDKETKERIYLD